MKRRKLPIESKIFDMGAGALNEGKEIFFSFFSIFSSLNFLFSSCLCLLFIIKEETPRLYFADKKSFIAINTSPVEDFLDAPIAIGFYGLEELGLIESAEIIFFLGPIGCLLAYKGLRYNNHDYDLLLKYFFLMM